MNTIFHLSFPVSDLEATRQFYGGVLGCRQGRTESDRLDFNFFGHHIVAGFQSADTGAGKTRKQSRGRTVPASGRRKKSNAKH